MKKIIGIAFVAGLMAQGAAFADTQEAGAANFVVSNIKSTSTPKDDKLQKVEFTATLKSGSVDYSKVGCPEFTANTGIQGLSARSSLQSDNKSECKYSFNIESDRGLAQNADGYLVGTLGSQLLVMTVDKELQANLRLMNLTN